MITSMVPALVDLLAAVDPTPAPQPIDEDKVSPGFIALAFLLVMGAAVVFLVRSMGTRLRNIDVDRHAREQEAKREAGGPRDDDPGLA
jgi:hypothetical protein